jgi:hypothetical protein
VTLSRPSFIIFKREALLRRVFIESCRSAISTSLSRPSPSAGNVDAVGLARLEDFIFAITPRTLLIELFVVPTTQVSTFAMQK